MYRVIWLQSAYSELTAIWLQLTDEERQQILAAIPLIDRRLNKNPHGVGESRPGRRRITFVYPLVVDFRVEPDDQTVSVLHVRFIEAQ